MEVISFAKKVKELDVLKKVLKRSYINEARLNKYIFNYKNMFIHKKS